MNLFYTVLYALGLRRWEELANLPASKQLLGFIDREHADRTEGRALDVGCGSGIWAMELARRGWDVVGFDIVPKAVKLAKERARRENVQVHFTKGDVTDIERSGIGSGFRLILDLGTIHVLEPRQQAIWGKALNKLATPRAHMIMYAGEPGSRHSGSPGIKSDELPGIYPGWKVVEEEPWDLTGIEPRFRAVRPRWIRMARVAEVGEPLAEGTFRLAFSRPQT